MIQTTPQQPLYFYDTLTRMRREFIPLQAGKVSMYSCGPTVYDSSHIGHARSFIVWDVVVRYLRHLDYDVTWARNITDIDDKIIKRAAEKNISPEKLARMETFKYWRDMHALNVSCPDHEPRATENLARMIDFIGELIAKGHAYQSSTGDVYFRVDSCPNYGQLKNICGDQVLSRVNHCDSKENIQDFALWKAFSRDEVGYETSLGYGRPGWHLECSTMIKHYLGESIDIHTGGEDLIFPHHENEIAQSECLHDGAKFSNYWLHNGLIMIGGAKMSKSEGNYITIHEALERFPANAIRFFILGTHYRQALNYTEEALTGAQVGVNKLLTAATKEVMNGMNSPINQHYLNGFREYMSDDFNTAGALSIAFELVKEINKGDESLIPTLREICETLGFNLQEAALAPTGSTITPLVDLLLRMRIEARQNKNFALADEIRGSFEQAGYQVKDSTTGSEAIPL